MERNIYIQDLSKYVFKLLSCLGNKDIFTIFKARCVVIKKYSQSSFVTSVYFFVLDFTAKHPDKWTIIETL